jgi:hypothetical protein
MMHASYTDHSHHTARFAKVPSGDGWADHRGSKPPIKGDILIETMHRTADGFAIGPRRKALFVHEDEWAVPKKSDGAIVKWRIAPPVEQASPTLLEPPEEMKKAFEEIAARTPPEAPEPPE